jgi:hypothetical protein
VQEKLGNYTKRFHYSSLFEDDITANSTEVEILHKITSFLHDDGREMEEAATEAEKRVNDIKAEVKANMKSYLRAKGFPAATKERAV